MAFPTDNNKLFMDLWGTLIWPGQHSTGAMSPNAILAATYAKG